MPNHVKNQNLNKKDPFANDVRVVNKKYLDKSYRALTARDQSMIDDTSSTFQLNRDQDRAFHIVANHATEPHSEQLKMYLGGMGGTGKSRVIQALSQFFKDRGESHRFLILAPTGSAAALLNGSTYHSILGINDRSKYQRNNSKESAQVRSRLEGVDYIFLDEVSMLSCHNMYQVSAATAKATGNVDEPFGGINMIFAGDFAQLPPVNGAALDSSSVGTQLMSSMHIRSQEETIGKALWHQITTVVILRENMRQRQQTIEDTKLRTALENMRYKACTPDDVAFLRTRVAGKAPLKPKLAQKRFRNVSIITAHNLQKDQINDLGAARFAADTNQTLTTFYSKDHFKSKDKLETKKFRRENTSLIDPKRRSNTIPLEKQQQLWELMPSTSGHVPGKISLCIGLPVMLRHNDATECCITKGAEGTIASWQLSRPLWKANS